MEAGGSPGLPQPAADRGAVFAVDGCQLLAAEGTGNAPADKRGAPPRGRPGDQKWDLVGQPRGEGSRGGWLVA